MCEKDFNEVFSKRLRYYLQLNDMKQNELAKRLGVGTTSVYNWCNGIKSPRMDKVDAMCKIFNCSRSDLMEENAPQKRIDRQKEDILLKAYNSLNDTGKDKVVDYANDLSQNPAYSAKTIPLHENPDPYKIHTLAAHERPGATEEGKQSDYDLIRQIKENHGGGGAKRE